MTEINTTELAAVSAASPSQISIKDTVLAQFKEAELGFDYATCTTAGDNTRQHRVLESCGWQRLSEFPNSKTGGTTVLWGWTVTDQQSEKDAV